MKFARSASTSLPAAHRVASKDPPLSPGPRGPRDPIADGDREHVFVSFDDDST